MGFWAFYFTLLCFGLGVCPRLLLYYGKFRLLIFFFFLLGSDWFILKIGLLFLSKYTFLGSLS